MCFRQEVGKCAICYNTVILGAADMAIDQGSFGLSISSAAIAIATLDTACSEDYLQIPGSGSDVGDADVDMFGPGTIPAILHERICGRFFGYETDGSGATDNTESIC
eukprot:TCALIF_12716-PA protein Name:"Protein of unknown function" AED:0.05 eAED:0.05 QI:0/1/0/1/1/0/2/0/106